MEVFVVVCAVPGVRILLATSSAAAVVDVADGSGVGVGAEVEACLKLAKLPAVNTGLGFASDLKALKLLVA